jgi:hypothetical protein
VAPITFAPGNVMHASTSFAVYPPDSSTWRRVGLGTAFWGVGVLVLWPGWAVTLLLLAPLVLVPLGLSLVFPLDAPEGSLRDWRTAVPLQLAAVILLAAFALPPGIAAAALALPWLAFTGFIALKGMVRACAHATGPVEEWCIDAGLIYLAIGGAWTLLSRWGMRPLGFSDDIVRATAIHFHYAGCILALLTGMAAREVVGGPARTAALGVMIGVPLVAVGITLSAYGYHAPEFLAAWFLSIIGLLVAWLQLRVAGRSISRMSRFLLLTSGAALVLGMSLSLAYSLGVVLGTPWLDIPQMVHWHGTINALGFALPGLLAWNLAPTLRR